MKLLIQDLNTVISLYRNLAAFPGLEKHKTELEDLKETSKFAQDYMGKILGETLEVEQSSGIKLNPLSPEQSETAKKKMEDSLKATKKILADKELMEKEPFLKGYLNMYKMQLGRALSDRDEALDYYVDDATYIFTFLSDQFEKLPTGQEYRQMPEHTKQTADKILDFIYAYTDCYDFPGMVQKAVRENPAAISEEKYLQTADQKLEKLQKATQRMADIPRDDVKQFFLDTGNKYSVKKNVDMLYGDKKHNPQKAAEQISDRRRQLKSYMTPEEARLLENFGGQVKGILGIAFGMGALPEHLPQSHKELTEGMIKLGTDCRQKLKDGFGSNAEKQEFFKNLGSQTRAFCEAFDHVNVPDDLDEDQQRALINITRELRENARTDVGALSQALRKEETLTNATRAMEPEFGRQLKQFYDMMRDTGSGYIGHKNSPEYTKMMDTIKTVAELSGKNPLNDVQREALGRSYGKLSEVCRAYLTDKKIGKKGTEVGEDRFAGALGILHLVDQENAERVRSAAQTKRKTAVTFEGLKERAEEKANARLQREAQAGAQKPQEREVQDRNAAQKQAEPGKRLSGVEQARRLVDDWYEKLKAVDYNMLGKGSDEFREVMESMQDLKNFADRNLKANRNGNISLESILDFHDKESAVIGKLQAYLDHKEDQMRADPQRRDDPKRAKREQPRIRTTIGLLEQMKTSQAETEAAVVSTMQNQARPKVEKLLADEETKRQAANISHEDYVKSTYRSVEMIRYLDGRNWSMEKNENLRHFCDRVQSYTDKKRYDKSLQSILDEKNYPGRPVLKEANKLFKGDKKNPEAFPGGEKLTNAQLVEKYAKLRSDQKTPYVEAKDIKPYDLKGKKTQIRSENKRMMETMVSQPKKQAAKSL